MKLSSRSRYGTRMMFELALNYGNGTMLLKEIGRKQGISEKYLSNLILHLKASGLVYSARGAHGGYMLAKAPSEITIKEIVDTLEGNQSIVECIKNESICDRLNRCPTRNVWEKLQEKFYKFLESITLQNLVEEFNRKQGSNTWFYRI
jgi:Rrf2 family cysteine metabolism transcriptional repressor